MAAQAELAALTDAAGLQGCPEVPRTAQGDEMDVRVDENIISGPGLCYALSGEVSVGFPNVQWIFAARAGGLRIRQDCLRARGFGAPPYD